MLLAFQTSLFLTHHHYYHSSYRQPLCRRAHRVWHANINRTSDSSREDEIAAKIARLRKLKRLPNQRSASSQTSAIEVNSAPESQQSENVSNAESESTTAPMRFEDLPDWKKEEVLMSQIEEAESFLKPTRTTPTEITDEKGEKYKPKVSTWGVYPRPDNISRTYGGGKRIRAGGVDLNSEAMAKRDRAVKDKLAAYRKAKGIDMEKEEEHREEIEEALRKSDDLVRRNLPYEAIVELENVSGFTNVRSRLGGKVYLSLAFAYETVGRRTDAREVYRKLRSSSYTEISSKAKQLLQGFEAMEQLKISDDTRERGYRVTNFRLPDVNYMSEKRYETAVGGQIGEKPEKISAQTNLILFIVMLSPVAILMALSIFGRR